MTFYSLISMILTGVIIAVVSAWWVWQIVKARRQLREARRELFAEQERLVQLRNMPMLRKMPGAGATILGMVRVEFIDREPVEYENVTEVEFTAAGGVVIRTQLLETITNPQDIRQKATVPAGPPRLLGAWSKDSHWTHVYQTEDESAAAERPSLEVAR